MAGSRTQETLPDVAGETCNVVLETWRRRCAPELIQTPELVQVLLEWSAVVAERVREGFSRSTLLCAIEGALRSRHNRDRGRAGRSISAIFGTPDRVRALAEVGAPIAFAEKRVHEVAPRAADVLSIADMRARALFALRSLEVSTHEKGPDHERDRFQEPAE